jgi:hypothetical protein
MSRSFRFCILPFLFLFLGIVHLAAQPKTTAPSDVAIWNQFVSAMRAGPIPADKVRPYDPSLVEPIVRILADIRKTANWAEWESTPEIYPDGNSTHYVIPLTIDGNKQTFCFTLLKDGNDWYFQHLESILIRLDRLPALPVTAFPDLPESQKAWMREENAATEQVRLFNLLATEKGKQFAFDWFRDGRGYALAAKTWVPVVSPSRAFILYLCWEQANLRGNPTRLEKLDDTEAIVHLSPIYLRLYEQTGNFKQRISLDDYRKIFETIWQDRAKAAGWNLELTYAGRDCILHFSKAPDPSHP